MQGIDCLSHRKPRTSSVVLLADTAVLTPIPQNSLGKLTVSDDGDK
jgi:hypothetical protein